MKEDIKDIAFRIHLEPLDSADKAAKVSNVIKVLNNIVKSYSNYLEIEFLKKEDFKIISDRNPKVLDSILDELQLRIVDLNFGSFEAALAPNIIENQMVIFNNDVTEWKTLSYNGYKKNVIMADYNDSSHMNYIKERYSENERNKIFKPFFTSVGDAKDYILNVTNSDHKKIRTLKKPIKEKLDFYLPKISIESDAIKYETIQVYVKMKEGENKLTQSNISEVLYKKKLEHETYPYKTDTILFEGITFSLFESIECSVDYMDDSYIIKNEVLDIVAWGDTRDEVEEAFAFSFYSLYINYFLEDDTKLSEGAIKIKKLLQSLIKGIINEA